MVSPRTSAEGASADRSGHGLSDRRLAVPGRPADQPDRATSRSTNATAMSTTRATWPTERARGSRRIEGRPRSMSTGAVRGSDQRCTGDRPGSRVSSSRPVTSERRAARKVEHPRWADPRQRRRCLSLVRAAGGSTAAQRCSRDGATPRQSPLRPARYGHSRRGAAASGASTGADASGGITGPRPSLGAGCPPVPAASSSVVIRTRIAGTVGARPRQGRASSGNGKIPATTYFPERLPSQYLRRWRA